MLWQGTDNRVNLEIAGRHVDRRQCADHLHRICNANLFSRFTQGGLLERFISLAAAPWQTDLPAMHTLVFGAAHQCKMQTAVKRIDENQYTGQARRASPLCLPKWARPGSHTQLRRSRIE